MYYLYLFSKIAKYIALISLLISFFSDLPIFKFLCILILFDIILDFTVLKCSILQVIGLFRVNHRFGENMPSIDNYENEVSYILPFQGRWMAVNGSYEKAYSHSWDIPTQRYAYDFLVLDESGKSDHGEYNQCSSYYCYDKEVLSPADGTVIKVSNSGKDSLIFPKGWFLSRSNHIAGNYIVIRHAEKEFSTLAHLKNGSISVKVGDVVSKGQCIAKCGNTGNSTEPHLHFQLQTSPSFYSSAGLPIQFRNVDISQVENYSKYDPRPHMSYDQILHGYITRGFAVENKA
ncbi:MAG TPA: M23 family metallopeptidase [Lachnospiraceae bacterium]|nr:M23 family metallopeptidase [Lachnospiraceae bacterium]